MLAILLLSASAWAGTFTAATCNRSDVNFVINGPTHTAVDGDIINIPAGTCTWTSGIVVPSSIGISIIGAGAGSTTIIDNYTTSPSWLIYFNPTFGNSLSRVSGITLSPQSGLGVNSLSAPLAFQGVCTASGCPNMRVDNITIPATPSWDGLAVPSGTLIVEDGMFGVIDHNSLTEDGSAGFYELVNFNLSNWKGVGQYGDNSWADADTYGTNQAIYVESNTFTQTGGILWPITETEGSFGLTSWGGGRVVCRFNTGIGMRSMCVNHGTESAGRPRGGRQMEFYKNSMTCVNLTDPCHLNGMLLGAGPRSGSLLNMANSYTWSVNSGINQYVAIAEYRALQSIGTFGPCDGSGQWDWNDGVTYFSGAIASVSGSNPYTITVSGSPGWSTNQWVSNGTPYSIHDVTIDNGSEIVSSTSNSVTVNAWTSIAYANGDSIQILRANACIDQSSRILGSLLSGNPPTPTNASGGWQNQTLDPVYEAGDTSTLDPVFGFVTTNTAHIIANRDFYQEVSQTAQTSSSSPFDGTAGTGFGTLARRPSTCTTGVGYWATDQGSWNTSGSGGQGLLYTCTSTNTWTLFYTPYSYPHPLIGGATAAMATTGKIVTTGKVVLP